MYVKDRNKVTRANFFLTTTYVFDARSVVIICPMFHWFEGQDGSQAVRPHWAKWSDSYVAEAEAKMKKAYADRLPALRRVAKEFDPHGVFVNEFFAKLLAP